MSDLVRVKTPLGQMWHLAEATGTRTKCGLVFSTGFDQVEPFVAGELLELELCGRCDYSAHRTASPLTAMILGDVDKPELPAMMRHVQADDDIAGLADDVELELDGDDDDDSEDEPSPTPKLSRRKPQPTRGQPAGDLIIENGKKRWRPAWA